MSTDHNDDQMALVQVKGLLLASPNFDLGEVQLYPFAVREPAAAAGGGGLVDTVEPWESCAANLYDSEIVQSHPEAVRGARNAVLW